MSTARPFRSSFAGSGATGSKHSLATQQLEVLLVAAAVVAITLLHSKHTVGNIFAIDRISQCSI